MQNNIDWSIVVVVAIPTIVAIAVGWWQVHTMRSLSQRTTDGLAIHSKSTVTKVKSAIRWLLYASGFFIFPIWNISGELLSSEPIDRFAGIIIAYSTGFIFFGIMLLIWSAGLTRTIAVLKDQSSINAKIVDQIDKLQHEIDSLTESKKRPRRGS